MAPATNGLAIASLVLAILWLAGIGSIVAVILGAVALSQIRKSQGRQDGRGPAIAGIVIGSLGILATALFVALAATFGHTVERALNPTNLGIGQTATFSASSDDGVVSIAVLSVRFPYASADTAYGAPAGHEFAVASVRECTGDAGQSGGTQLYWWELHFSDGTTTGPAIDAVFPGLDTVGALGPHTCAVGSLTFQVPIGSVPKSIEYRGDLLTPFRWLIPG